PRAVARGEPARLARPWPQPVALAAERDDGVRQSRAAVPRHRIAAERHSRRAAAESGGCRHLLPRSERNRANARQRRLQPARGDRRRALVWPGLFVLANAIEVLSKTTVQRAPLYANAHGQLIHVAVFDNSFPSGHALRAALLAATLASAWPALAGWLSIWVGA